ncbi:LytR/AlgR family response regulator transcription factor [Pedobacter metabolipauper]|uniref:LytTR family two component transcriptional regulator n=1 Tax=Pedobacter metabolipauper TaxID=425513 RepID=A0A4R6SWD4_9SPHI|nr:LytTR family DNA-binding domain-containing protein [Pedobacter metabolipauper]TDQ08691.1 LytTR family two component transcriptional regulator [Pedobacter metabolipauper]
MIINCIAVDDEPAALNLVSSYINQTPFLQLSAKFNNALDALQHMHANPGLQLIFLDIRMADLNGVELARIIEQSDKRKSLRVIFTTAYDQYALEGFRVDALDYLVKPFSFVDFSKAAAKAYDYFVMMEGNQNPPDRGSPQIDEVKQYVYVKVEHQLVKVEIDDIRYIEGLKDYVKIYLRQAEKPLLTLTSLKKLQEKLPANQFLRLHRSFIVSTSAIKSATKTSVLIGDTTIYVSEQFKESFNEFLSKWVL